MDKIKLLSEELERVKEENEQLKVTIRQLLDKCELLEEKVEGLGGDLD